MTQEALAPVLGDEIAGIGVSRERQLSRRVEEDARRLVEGRVEHRRKYAVEPP